MGTLNYSGGRERKNRGEEENKRHPYLIGHLRDRSPGGIATTADQTHSSQGTSGVELHLPDAKLNKQAERGNRHRLGRSSIAIRGEKKDDTGERLPSRQAGSVATAGKKGPGGEGGNNALFKVFFGKGKTEVS